ncbi:UDP-N-acetylglucosamine 1-carboxyvinyltransferase [Clostridium sp. K25]|uniref:UDP-N-acetylglucosamine 1-carboxyvinyltransferase n=1 Tax=Clostridium botulinum D str. 1873 TaxID=592027 RepID=A0A9P2G8W3_CLOBO|nr:MULTISPECIES: UDP-N-acetylglucosamine 1-carboxyvinyltransferase [Clostridium]AYF54186.1 UDP-N-acetylglucosamine 1-carboxyvinyltransferase [Clostridium novyi]EES92103.1 UDP-N-acetylglucosamine 1-carboxyvinyltransferase [Clostridium botulinum D str. 1873]KEI10986.1 UDP-N-acetylglucosamine 1-carboxyvinyltransferase [Clostridium sp. K25]MBO3441196.1 UDP-N-acetylglucosamine 1-carboxyvinyltransferase [Clostridium haemolyticum]MCD3216511.1 UDP-N-acetylglucosamine 1-carboxyvinyltransferase [Clostri
MENILIKGGKKLRGEVNISSAKNAILPIIAASILCGDKCIIKNAPMLKDVFVISDVLRNINADIKINSEENIIKIDTSRLVDKEPDSELVRKMRASFLIMGPMIARFGKFKLSLPGGCNIGTRPIDLHLKGFAALGATVNFGHGYVEAYADKLVGNKIYLDFPSVGATENIMMAAVLAEGKTIIGNPAGEPEIQDLANFLNSMGAKIVGAGTDMIKIQGVKELKGSIYTPIPDRIEAGTFMAAAAITRSDIKINHINTKHLNPIISKLNEIGVVIEKHENSINVNGDRILKPVDIKTMPYPGFPTDMQAQMMSLLCTINGTSIITETIFENRFMHVGELKKMGGNIKIDGRCAVVEGVNKLTGCEVKATDLRAGAALILGGLAAEGYTKIGDIYHIDRGYFNIEQKFLNLGADIKRIKE